MKIDDYPIADYSPSIKHYGADKVAQNYCGINGSKQRIIGIWQHGMLLPEHLEVSPGMVTDGEIYLFGKQYFPFFVARQDEETNLKRLGFKHVTAIGLPIIYTKTNKVKRRKGSLLAMPSHSSVVDSEANIDSYLDFLRDLRGFDSILVCLHAKDFTQRNISKIQELGLKVIKGAEDSDINSLERMALLFKSFEFTTSNGYGSHLAYASYFGSKVSVSGPERKLDPVIHSSFFQQNDGMQNEAFHLQKIEQEFCKFLSCEPADIINAEQNQEWGNYWVGESNKRSPSELASILGFGLTNPLKSSLLWRRTQLHSWFYHLSNKKNQSLESE